VDEHNRVLGGRARAEVRGENLRHQATYIFLHDAETGKLYVQLRARVKDYFPSYWDPAPGGVVQFGESYALNAERELEEEMGVRGVPLEPCFEFLHEDEHTRCWGGVFRAVWRGSLAEIRMQPEEVEDVRLMSVEEILREARAGGKWTPDGIRALESYASWVVQRDVLRK
jgi:isopentenyldiphosphate isomerase